MTSNQIVQNGGGHLLSMHKGSPIHLLQHVYPEYNWSISKRHTVPHRYWNDIEHQRKSMDELETNLSIFNIPIKPLTLRY